MKLRTFLPGLLFVLFTITTLISFFTIRYYALNEVSVNQLKTSQSSINLLQGNIEGYLRLNNITNVQKNLSSYSSKPDINLIFVTDKHDQIIASSNLQYVGLDWKTLETPINSQTASEVVQTKVTDISTSKELNLLTGYASICNGERSRLRPARCGFLYYELDTQYQQNQATASLYELLILSILGFLFSAFLFSIIIYFRVTQRVTQLVDVLDEFSKGNRQIKVQIQGKDELSAVGHSVNRLFEQLIKERADLIASERMQRAIIQSAGHAIITTNTDGLIQTFNRAAEEMLGYSAEEMINKHSPATFHLVDEIVEQAAAQSSELGFEIEPGFAVFSTQPELGKTYTREWTYVRKDGSQLPVLLSMSAVLNEEHEVTAFLGIASDLTAQKQSEKVKSEFISTVSHELRTPLTSIKGSLGLIRSGAIGDLSDKLKAMLEIAYSNSDRLIGLINDILDIEKISAGKMDFHMEAMDLEALVKESIAANQGYAKQHNTNFMLQTSIGSANIKADKNRLMQVMANLLSNAAKFTEENTQVHIKLLETPTMYRVEVIDEGSGIPLDYQSRIFERFTQADSSDTRKKGGTGLGLSIAQNIVEKHLGKLDFISSGQGTTFYFELPKPVELIDKSTPTTQTHIGNPDMPRILICEDDLDTSNVLSQMLQRNGYTTDISKSAEEAKEALNTNQYDAITVDLDLPGQDGISFIIELRQTTAFKDLPIVVISANIEQGKHNVKTNSIDVIDWIQKPFEQDRLSEALKLAVQKIPKEPASVLHIEDDPDIVKVTQNILQDVSLITQASNLASAKALLTENNYDLVILDLSLPDGNGEEILPFLNRQGRPPIPVVIFSVSELSISDAANSIKAQLIKSTTDNETFLSTIRNAIEGSKHRR